MAYIGNPAKYVNFPSYSNTSNGVTVSYLLPWTPGTPNALLVVAGGVVQTPAVDYTVSNATLTFTTALPNGVTFTVSALGLNASPNVPAVGSVVPASMAANSVLAQAIAPGAIEGAITSQFSHRNRIINGAMQISQRGWTWPAMAEGYAVDRWFFGKASTGVYNVLLDSSIPPDLMFRTSLSVTVATADTSIATTEVVVVQQAIEGFNVRDLIGHTFTLSFRVKSSKTGTHCVSFRNTGRDRTYIAEYTINAANTWETKSITVSGGLITTGTWDWTNGSGLAVAFTLAAGSNYQTTKDAWQTGNFFGTANQVNCLDTIGNVFAITGVQLEAGSVATPFEHRPHAIELSLCHRYLSRAARTLSYGVNSSVGVNWRPPVPMRVTPTVTGSSTPYWENITFSSIGSATGVTYHTGHLTNLGGMLLCEGTFSPVPANGQMSEIDLESVLFSAEI
jgi:hypothetical protein